jgi:uncharacterized protein
VTVELRVQPRARRTALDLSAGTLKAAVTAPPEDGKANDAVIALLAEAWRLPKSTMTVIKGATARGKTLAIAGDAAALAARVKEWVRGHG